MFVALEPLIIAPDVIACFMESILNAVILRPNCAKRGKLVPDAWPSTLLSRVKVTDVDTLNVPSVMIAFLFMTTSVIFNPS